MKGANGPSASRGHNGATRSCRLHGARRRRLLLGLRPSPRPRGRQASAASRASDSSPFHAEIGGVKKGVQIASLVVCYSRLLFFQCYPRFRRFECKCFLADAVAYVGGVCPRCMIDNTHVVVLRGTGKDMVPVPEMVAFGERLGGFAFAAHEIGDANRSARARGKASGSMAASGGELMGTAPDCGHSDGCRATSIDSNGHIC